MQQFSIPFPENRTLTHGKYQAKINSYVCLKERGVYLRTL